MSKTYFNPVGKVENADPHADGNSRNDSHVIVAYFHR